MLKTLFSIAFAFTVCICCAQVRIGYNSGAVNQAAVLELSNNAAAAPTTWQSFVPPKVDFTNAAFTSNYIWGIAGLPTAGAIVYNTGDGYTNGFSGTGMYCWQRNCWAPLSILVTDRIKLSLSTSLAAYDAAVANTWVNVTAAEYANLLTVVNGSSKYATPEIYMNTSASNGWTTNYTIGGSNNAAKLPASSYIIAWSVRTGIAASNSLGSKLKVSASQNTGYIDYGGALPTMGSIAANTRVYFVLKTPAAITPAAPSYTAVYNAVTHFLGNNATPGSGPEYYILGDGGNPATAINSDSYSQIISTQIRQW